MPKKKTQKLINLPTVLTLLRIVLVVPLMVLFFIDELPAQVATLVCFVVAAVTDFVDGRIARKRKIVTDLGAFLDPLADKMLVNLTFLMLVCVGLMPIWMFAVILVRDFAVDGMRMMLAKDGITVSASIFGKAKTMTQMIVLTSILINKMCGVEVWGVINNVLLYAVIGLTVYSGMDYLVKGWGHLTGAKSNTAAKVQSKK